MRFSRFFFLASFAIAGCAASTGANSATFFKYDFTHIDTKLWYISNGWANGNWQSCEWRSSAISTQNGKLELTLSDHGGTQRPIGCAEIRTTQTPGYGLYEARMRTVAGSGLNTAFFTYIGPTNGKPWDEIDFEFLGKDPTTVQTNFYTNGKSAGGSVIQLGFNATQDFHNYAIDWQPTKIRWYVDGKLVHESADGATIPSHPGSLFLSLWSGAAQENDWLGEFHYTQPVTAQVQWAAFSPPGSHCLFPQSASCQ